MKELSKSIYGAVVLFNSDKTKIAEKNNLVLESGYRSLMWSLISQFSVPLNPEVTHETQFIDRVCLGVASSLPPDAPDFPQQTLQTPACTVPFLSYELKGEGITAFLEIKFRYTPNIPEIQYFGSYLLGYNISEIGLYLTHYQRMFSRIVLDNSIPVGPETDIYGVYILSLTPINDLRIFDYTFDETFN